MSIIKYKQQGFFAAVSLLVLACFFSSCTKLVEIEPPITSVSSTSIYEKDVTAASVLTGIYTTLSGEGFSAGSMQGTASVLGLSSDELSYYMGSGNPNQVDIAYYTNTLTREVGGSEYWNNIYPKIFVVNSALEELPKASAITPAVKKQLLGEARFMRAFFYYYLVNLYGDVCLVLTTDYKVNALISRSPKEKVWEQIIEDLKEAQSLLSSEYLDAGLITPTNERVRPTQSAATALLARAYLYTGDWEHAEIEATRVIDNPSYQLIDLAEVFLKNNKEAIWQLQPIMKGGNTAFPQAFDLGLIGGFAFSSVYLSPILVNSFDAGDLRQTFWTGSVDVSGTVYHYASKYKVPLSGDENAPFYEYLTVIRLAEQYLIRAEARIQQDKIADGIDDLNKLRDRATDKTAPVENQLQLLSQTLSKEQALLAVEHERQVEFFTEWGHRWFDLKRTGRIDPVMTQVVPQKIGGETWKSYQQWFPISPTEIKANPHLEQTAGY